MNVILNTQNAGSRFAGSSGAPKVLLPEDHVPIFLWMGDSTSLGFTGTTTDTPIASQRAQPRARVAPTAFERVNYGFYWDKFCSTADAGVTFSKSASTLASATVGADWSRVHAELGGIIPYASQAYGQAAPTTANMAPTPLWYFMQRIYGLFQVTESTGPSGHPTETHVDIDLPKAIFYAQSGAKTGGVASASYNPVGGALYTLFTEYYIKPALLKVYANGKIPVICGLVMAAGAGDSSLETHDTFEALQAIRRGLEDFMDVESFPVLQQIPWYPASTNTTYPQDQVARSRTDALKACSDYATEPVFMDEFERDADGVHFRWWENYAIGQAYADAYTRMLAGSEVIVGPEAPEPTP